MHRNVLIANVTGFSLSFASMSLLNLSLAQSRTSDLLKRGNMMIRARYILPDWDIVLPLSRCQHWAVFLTLKSLLFLLSFSLLLYLHISHPSPLVSSLFSVSVLSLLRISYFYICYLSFSYLCLLSDHHVYIGFRRRACDSSCLHTLSVPRSFSPTPTEISSSSH